jgi:serine/threonine-protein kinase RsbW
VPITRLCRTLLTLLCSQLDKPAAERPALPDDLSVVVIEVEGPGKLTEHSLRAADVHDLSRQRAKLSRHLATELHRQELHVEPGRLGMVLEEAIYNAWKHGNRQSPDADIRVRHCIGNDLHIEIEDEGQGFALEDIPDPTAPENRSKPSGRGLFIIRRFADEASWQDGGRRLSLRFATSPWFMPSHSQGTMPALPLWK